MLTINILLKEIKNVPLEKLDEVYQYIHSMSRKNSKSEKVKKKIMSYAGIFNDMADEDYSDYLLETKRMRANLFDRKEAL
jgi:hypothetical protein